MKKISFQFVAMLLVIGLSACGGRHHHDNDVKAAVPAPVLSFLPLSGAVGTMVTLSGTDFSAASSVSINGVSAIVVNKSTSALTAMVMPGASTSGSVDYTSTAGTTTAIPGTFTLSATGVPATQQGTKLNSTVDAYGYAQQGYSVAVSADGNTAVVGGPFDNGKLGAAWVYTRSGTGTTATWAQQAKLVDSSAVGGIPSCTGACQGWSVAVNADGNTAVVGGPYDTNSAGTAAGAAWVYTRSGTTWTQQDKLIATDASSYTYQGSAVAVSADGNTAVVGGTNDNSSAGAAWVWTRSGTTWTQQGSKLVGNDATVNACQGWSVAVSADGNTAVVGGLYDNSATGAAWVWTRSGTTWTQQGSKLVGSAVAGSELGSSVAVSADGNTAVVGGYTDNSSVGAAWVWTRSGTTWTQQGSKFVGTGATGASWQGSSVALSADGNTAVVGGSHDSSSVGAAWIYTP